MANFELTQPEVLFLLIEIYKDHLSLSFTKNLFETWEQCEGQLIQYFTLELFRNLPAELLTDVLSSLENVLSFKFPEFSNTLCLLYLQCSNFILFFVVCKRNFCGNIIMMLIYFTE